MKRFLVYLTMILSAAFAADAATVFCQLLFDGHSRAKSAEVKILWGNKVPKGSKVRFVNGDKVEFDNVVDALDFMAAQGWEIATTYLVDEGEDQVIMLKKEVQANSDIFSGFMLK